MNIVKCLCCGHEFPLEKTYGNGRSRFAVCTGCGSAFETNEEVELSDRHIERIDEIHNSVHEMCKKLTENVSLEWDMRCIGEIADFAADTLVLAGNKVRYPAVVIDENGRQYIVEYHGEEVTESAKENGNEVILSRQ